MVRSQWLNLNGPWNYQEDPGDSGEERGLVEKQYAESIVVPFCRESKLSGLEREDRCLAVWYRKVVAIPPEWEGQRVLLHFGAADYETTLWVDGRKVAYHRGGHTSFFFDITDWLQGQEATLCVRCRDDWRTRQPRGKQSVQVNNTGCFYQRTTGIWQTVWMEPVPQTWLRRPRMTPLVEQRAFHIEQSVTGGKRGQSIRARLHMEGCEIASTTSRVGVDFVGHLFLSIPEKFCRLWEPGAPHLYDITIELLNADATVCDTVHTYAGLRSLVLEGNRFLINDKSVYQKLVLDQGYYPDGLLTAPSDEELQRDIRISMAAGFNGARLHQKIFEERFLTHADRMGYLVWGEFPDWCQWPYPEQKPGNIWDTNFVVEWLEALERDYNHPSIIGWCPMNEATRREGAEVEREANMRAMFHAAKLADRTRPVVAVSGWGHILPETDIYDHHTYNQDAAELKKIIDYTTEPAGTRLWERMNHWPHNIGYAGQPFFVSEFGGMQWPAKEGSWGYGEAPKTLEEYYARFEAMCAVQLDHPACFGYCFTQLTDVSQECNGLYYADRTEKFSLDPIRAAQRAKDTTQ